MMTNQIFYKFNNSGFFFQILVFTKNPIIFDVHGWMLIADVNHLSSMMFKVLNLALYPAMQAVYGILLEPEEVRQLVDVACVRCTTSRH